MIINLHKSSCQVPVIFCHTLMELRFYRQIFEKYSNINAHENRSCGSWVVPCGWTDGQTDRHDEVNSLFFYNADAPKNETGPIFMPCNIPILISHTRSPVMTMMIMAMMTVILFCSARLVFCSRATNAYRATRGTVTFMPNLGVRKRWDVNATPLSLNPLQMNPAHIKQEVRWAPETVWTFCRKEISLVRLRRLEPQTAQSLAHLSIPTGLFRHL